MTSGIPSSGRSLRVLRSWLTAVARSRFFPLFVAALGVSLASPALGVGWIQDDFYHRAVLLPNSPYRELLGTPAEMFRFFRGDPVRTHRIMDLGVFPWWTDPILKAEFLQALTVLTHRLDYALWPDSPALMHAQSLCWLGASLAAVAVFYRRLLGPTAVAATAALLYAVDDARGLTVGFIANRNVLIAATFGVSVLIFHDRWRRDGTRWAAPLAAFLLACALFSKEEGIGTCAYLAAYGLFADRTGRWRGCMALSPYVAIVVFWRVLRHHWGYGVQNMGLYVDPLTDPEPFMAALARRAPVLMVGQWGPIPAEFAVVLRASYSAAFLIAAVAFVCLLVLALAPLLKRNRLASFWAAGMVFAAVPVCATLPMDRLLTFPGIGAFGLLAQFFARVFDGSPKGNSIRWLRVLAWVLAWFFLVVHVVYAPIALPVRAANPLGPRWVEERCYVQMPLGPAIAQQTLVIVNAPSPVHAGYTGFRQFDRGKPIPGHIRVLAPAIPSVAIRRLDTHTLEIRPASGYIDWVLDKVFRGERRPMALGEDVKLTGMTARVTALTDDGRPAVATFRFDTPLESDSLVWLCFKGKGFEPFSLPAVGDETEIRFDWRTILTP
jgi:hypothetical protein